MKREIKSLGIQRANQMKERRLFPKKYTAQKKQAIFVIFHGNEISFHKILKKNQNIFQIIQNRA